MHCSKCGKGLPENSFFCSECGASQVKPAAPNKPRFKRPSAPNIPRFKRPAAQNIPWLKRPSANNMITLIMAVFLIIACGAGTHLLLTNIIEINSGYKAEYFPASSDEGYKELPQVSYTYQGKKPEVVMEFTTVDSIFPSNYRMLESLVTFTGYCDYGETDVLIEVEVPGFTQNYKQKVRLGRQLTKLRIIPPLVTGELDLNSEKMAQLSYSVTEIDTGRLLEQQSKSIKLFSKYDMVWWTPEYGYANSDNILAWMTPDATEILELKRNAIDYLEDISEGKLDMLLGYQDYNYFDDYYDNTWVQAVAIQGAMSDITNVRYNNSLFSIDTEVNQRIKLPGDTLNSRSGLCIETSLVMASALQSAGMHVMLILPPGHAQVAVEAWPDTGDYFLIETTNLPMQKDSSGWKDTVQYLTKEEWYSYITGDGGYDYGECYIVDCDLGALLGIRPMSN